ncbi:MAG: formyltetrahydrofolate deformylase [Ilumatobacteraceae bacterium]
MHHIVTLTCHDRPGLVHAVTSGILDVDGNIVESHQFTEPDTLTFCMRIVVDSEVSDSGVIQSAIQSRLGGLDTSLTVRLASRHPKLAVLVSKFDHCLVDLLYRWRTGDLAVDIAVVVSNHPDCRDVVEQHGIPYFHVPVSSDTKQASEDRLRQLIEQFSIDLVVLARYMQVFSEVLCKELESRAINIHHSFLPSFKGASPYRQAHARGVKLIGATAHYVTADLDEGPIIEQDVVRVDHAHTAEQLAALGRDIERSVLSRAVGLWSQNRVLLVGSKTVVFR